MAAWLTYFKERFPLPVYLCLVGGFSASGTLVGGGRLGSWSFWLSFAGLMVFFAMLRMMDEVKDYEKDRIANPTRPLPRGLLDLTTVKRVIGTTVALMLIFGAGLSVFSFEAAIVYVLLTCHLWLMYREFYLGHWLEERQLLYATSHQLVLVWVSVFPAILANAAAARSAETWLYAFLVLGSFFSYEVCRKLDPRAHPLLRTYRSIYGVGGCFAIVSVTSAIAVLAAGRLQLGWLLWPCSALLLASFVFLRLGRHKVVEAIASLSLIAHISSIAIMRFLG